jgi:WD40 repeat protein
MRTCKSVASQLVHKAAINFLTIYNGLVVTGSADKTIKMFDPTDLQRPIVQMNATDAVFCGEVVDNLIVAGCGDGNILVFDSKKGGECLYGFGADSVGALHCLKVTADRKSIVTGGDSGQALKLNFSGF